LREHPLTGNNLLDLGCGTGTLALLIAERGWQVIGIDRSPAMLHQARRKASRAAVDTVRFVEDDIRAFNLDTSVNLATCCYDTLNYLLDESDLQRCFESVARATVQGGLFCFDLATDYFLRHYWDGTEVAEFRDYTQIMQSHYDAASGCSTLVLTGFVRSKQGSYRRFREIHMQRSYAEATIRTLLEANGFNLEGVYDCFTLHAPYERSLRVMYVARRC